MSRPIVLSNGNLFIGIAPDLDIRDLTYPRVGFLNHLSGARIRLGIWVNGHFNWMSGSGWTRRLAYRPNTLVSDTTITHSSLGIQIRISEAVTHHENIFIRRLTLHNQTDTEQEVRLFLASDFHIAETDIGDTAFYNPFLDAVIHYKRDAYFLLTGNTESDGIYQYATGIKGFQGAEGVWRDAENGVLSMNPIAQGSVDSVFSLRMKIGARRSSVANIWLCAGHNLTEVSRLHDLVVKTGVEELLRDTERYWATWSAVESETIQQLPEPIPELFRRSLLIIRALIDNHGAVIAAIDSDIMETARAHYAYMWPRDGALVTSVLDRLGYQDITRRFFRFCRDILPTDRAAFFHKYSADGSLGASWHPWTVDGWAEIPFQQDSTALVLWALWKHYNRYRDLEFVESLYDSFIRPCGEFILSYRYPDTGLPQPSYDVWEERRGILAFTCGSLYGALIACARFADIFGETSARSYLEAADQLRNGCAAHLWDEPSARFARRIECRPDNTMIKDTTIDSSLYALFAYGAFSPDDPRIVSTMRQVVSRLWVQTEVGGLARYENDYYFRRSDDIAKIPGNPWFICTLWAAQYHLRRACNRKDLLTPMELILWAAKHATESGIFPEQLDPYTGNPLSVSPLTWSHAEFVNAVLDYLDCLTRIEAVD